MTSIANSHTPHAARISHLLVQASEAPAQHVFTQIYHERALAQAKALDDATQRGEALGALQGMVVSLKDNFDVAGETTLAGTIVCQGEPVAQQDAVAVARLRAADAIFIRSCMFWCCSILRLTVLMIASSVDAWTMNAFTAFFWPKR